MEHEKLQEYTARITQANRTQLVVITYELIEDSIREAMDAISRQDEGSFAMELERAQKLLYEMMTALDMQYPISVELMQLYSFSTKRIIQAKFKKSAEELPGVIRILEKLHQGFKQIAEQDSSGPLMMNTQQIYAGLTYGKNSLNEVFVNGNERNRGYQA